VNKKIIFIIGLLSGVAICGLLNWGINASFMSVSIAGYNSLNDRVKDLEGRQAYVGYELQTEKGNREYSLKNIYSSVRAIEDRLSDTDIQKMRVMVISQQEQITWIKEQLLREELK